MPIVLILIVILLALIVANIKIVPEAQAYVVERLGAYSCTWNTGVHIKIPLIEKVAKKVSLKEAVVDFPPQPVITKDNVTMQIDTVIFYKIMSPEQFAYGVERPMMAIENLTATTLRNIIGEMELDATLTSRDVINSKITAVLDHATDPWGIKITRVELKNIAPPREIQESMEKQMKAERERREKILQAEGDKKSAILVAEGERESAILRAQAEKEAAILRADAIKETKIREAEGEAIAITKVQEATAEGIHRINEANPGEGALKIKAIEAFAAIADGKATKIIIPSEIQGLVGLAEGVISGVKKDSENKED